MFTSKKPEASFKSLPSVVPFLVQQLKTEGDVVTFSIPECKFLACYIYSLLKICGFEPTLKEWSNFSIQKTAEIEVPAPENVAKYIAFVEGYAEKTEIAGLSALMQRDSLLRGLESLDHEDKNISLEPIGAGVIPVLEGISENKKEVKKPSLAQRAELGMRIMWWVLFVFAALLTALLSNTNNFVLGALLAPASWIDMVQWGVSDTLGYLGYLLFNLAMLVVIVMGIKSLLTKRAKNNLKTTSVVFLGKFLSVLNTIKNTWLWGNLLYFFTHYYIF